MPEGCKSGPRVSPSSDRSIISDVRGLSDLRQHCLSNNARHCCGMIATVKTPNARSSQRLHDSVLPAIISVASRLAELGDLASEV